MSQRLLVFHSALAPGTIAETLRRDVDQEQYTPFSLSGYKGSKPLLGDLREGSFRLRKRIYYSNGFARRFYATYSAEPGGTRIEGYFDAPLWARWFMRIWVALAVAIGTPIFALTLIDAVRRGNAGGNLWTGLAVPPALLLCGLLLPRIGRLLGTGGERYVLSFVEQKLAARRQESESAG